jgi:putative membrane protein
MSLASETPAPDRFFYVANALISGTAVFVLGWILMWREPAGGVHGLTFMPAVNAMMNAVAASCLVAGFVAIRRKKRELHRRLMLGALSASAIFLIGYLVYHWFHGDTLYPADAPWRGAYLVVLASHVVLSIIVFPMIIATFWFALSGRFARHRKLARVTLPMWLYVSVTGVAVFLMLRSALG